MTDTHKAAAEAAQADTDDRGPQITSHLNARQLRNKVPHNHTMGCIMAFQGLPFAFFGWKPDRKSTRLNSSHSH